MEHVEYIELRHDDGETSGAFWTDSEFLGAEYEDVHAVLGISRTLFEDATRWSRSSGTLERKIELLRRLRAEVPPSIEVERSADLD